MSPQEVAESFALTDSIVRAMRLRSQMFACEAQLEGLKQRLAAHPSAGCSEELRRTRLEAVQIGRALLTACDEIAAINFRRAYPGRESGG
ncbi:hypothetical protein [Lacipirellula sp.]|uniref:hypothetical protein n=1 Tax=Lacipirellula sp. TaxID=2691419 RepID=UPI003D0D8ABB